MKSKYKHRANEDQDHSPNELIPLFLQMFSPASLVDVGCGVGNWLKKFEEHGITNLLGIDGFHLNKDFFQLPQKYLRQMDLEAPTQLNLKFDLLISLEVAEHISEKNASTFVHFLTTLSNNIIFSAAIPGQGGQNHINEQWPSYWQKQFNQHGYYFQDIIRPRIWWNRSIKPYYRQNIFVATKEPYQLKETLPIFDLVHQDLLIDKAKKYLTGAGGLNKTLKAWK